MLWDYGTLPFCKVHLRVWKTKSTLESVFKIEIKHYENTSMNYNQLRPDTAERVAYIAQSINTM